MSSKPSPRSYLFVPGNRPDRFAKACATAADAVIIDLEDAVPPDDKAAARSGVAAWVAADHPVLVRINGAETSWFREDLELARMPGIVGIVLPKAERTEDVEAVVQHAARGAAIVPLIETARGLWNALAIAQVPGVERLAFGSIDFELDLGLHGDAEQLLPFRAQLVLLSRVAGIVAPVDGVTTDLSDVHQLAADTLRARRLGFGAKLCIHPNQVATVNEGFSPDASELAWAQRVIQAAEAARGAAVALDGKMIDAPVIAKARAVVDAAQRGVRRSAPHD
jgi:citrate lyase subunit beta / citryl-CoA lyase